jgi:ABC-type transport system substrate-binding protein
MEQGRRESDPAKLRAVYVQLTRLLLDEAASVPLVDELAVWAYRSNVQGTRYNFNAYPVLSDAHIVRR